MPAKYNPQTQKWSFDNGDINSAEDWKWILAILMLVGAFAAVCIGVISLIFF